MCGVSGHSVLAAFPGGQLEGMCGGREDREGDRGLPSTGSRAESWTSVLPGPRRPGEDPGRAKMALLAFCKLKPFSNTCLQSKQITLPWLLVTQQWSLASTPHPVPKIVFAPVRGFGCLAV